MGNSRIENKAKHSKSANKKAIKDINAKNKSNIKTNNIKTDNTKTNSTKLNTNKTEKINSNGNELSKAKTKTHEKKELINEKPKKEKNTKTHKKHKKGVTVVGTTFKVVLIIILTFILVFFCRFFLELRRSNGNITSATFGVLQNVAGNVINEEDPVYILLLGYSTDEGSTLTDTIILAGYNPSTQKAFMLSIPRDTFVGDITGPLGSYNKINAWYEPEDASKTIEEVENITGVDIDYYVAINTETLTDIVDVLGGVEFYVPIDMNYDDPSQDLHIHIEEGLQLVDGEKAEGLLRFRHNNDGTSYPEEYGDNDYGRMRTQREFLTEMAKQCLETNDMSTLREIISAVFDSLETNCPLSVMLSYLVYIYDFDMDNLQVETLPGESDMISGIWFFINDEEETEELLDNMIYRFNSDVSNYILEQEYEENKLNDTEDDLDEDEEEELNSLYYNYNLY